MAAAIDIMSFDEAARTSLRGNFVTRHYFGIDNRYLDFHDDFDKVRGDCYFCIICFQ